MRPHPVDMTALVLGTIFALEVAAWFAYDTGLLALRELMFGAPVGLIVLGAVGIIASLARNRPGDRASSGPPGSQVADAPPHQLSP